MTKTDKQHEQLIEVLETAFIRAPQSPIGQESNLVDGLFAIAKALQRIADHLERSEQRLDDAAE